MQRNDVSADAIRQVTSAFKQLRKSSLTLQELATELTANAHDQPEVQMLASFIADTKRGIAR